MPKPVLSLARFTPSETIRKASTSSPESVSSKIANFGFRISSCKTSARFFSPPENPSFTERDANFGSILKRFIASLSSLTHARKVGASPLTSVFAVRKKFVIETPGTSTGYCIARNRPAFARSSGVIFKISSPSRSTWPESTSYFG